MKRTAAFLCAILSFAAASIAQVSGRQAVGKTVTNADLERYRLRRLTAEREYRENYARLGFPSPEELSRQIEQSRIERERLDARLRSERIERERLDVDRMRAAAELATAYAASSDGGDESQYYNGYYGGLGFYGGFGSSYDGYRFRRFGRNRHFFQPAGGFGYLTIPGYRATPVGVFDAPVRIPVFTRPSPRRLQ